MNGSDRLSTFKACSLSKAKNEASSRGLFPATSTAFTRAFTGEVSQRFLRTTLSEVPAFLPATFRLTPPGIAFFALSAFVLRLTELENTAHTAEGASEVEVLFCFLAALLLASLAWT